MKNFFKTGLELILKNLSRKILNKSNAEIIGVTGSVGKSSTKEAIFRVLNGSEKYVGRVNKSEENLNNEIGLPLSILGFKKGPIAWQWPGVIIVSLFRSIIPALNPLKNISILVLEYASDKPGDIKYLTSIARPKIAVVTNIGEAHLEFYQDINQIALEKSMLVKVLNDDGYAILNSDDDYVWRMGLSSKAQVTYFGTNDKAMIKAANIHTSLNGTSFDVSSNNENKKVTMKIVGKHHVYSALAAIAIGKIYKIKLEESIKSLANFDSLPGRDKIIKGINGSLIIDSSYNANLSSTKAMLETFKNIKSPGRKIAILGDMCEMGEISKKAHKEIGEMSKKIAGKLIAVGSTSKLMKADKWFDRSQEAAEYMKNKIKKGDIILVKGSHAMEMEKIIKILTNTNGDNTNGH